MTAPDLLVLAAFSPELAAFRAGLAALDEASALGPLRVDTATVGVGLVAAAVGAARCLGGGAPTEAPPRAIIFLGTCGVFRHPTRTLPVGSPVVGRTLRLVEPAVVEGRSAFPGPMAVELPASPALGRALAIHGGTLVDVATTLGITTDDGLSRILAEGSGAQVEHLEAYAVGSACEAFGVPFAPVLGIANEVGARGRVEWRAHHEAASEAAARVVLSWLRAGAKGLAIPHGTPARAGP